MSRFRFTIAGNLAVVATCAIYLSALRAAADWWLGFVSALSLFWLFYAVRSMVQDAAPGRRFWAGFLALGVTYALVANGPWLPVNLHEELPTTKLLTRLYASMAREEGDSFATVLSMQDGRGNVWRASMIRAAPAGAAFTPKPGPMLLAFTAFGSTEMSPTFDSIGHFGFAFLIGLCGGILATLVRFGRRRPAADETADQDVGVNPT